MKRALLVQGPGGSPNFCFGLYVGRKYAECLEFVQSDWDYASLASRIGWQPCKCGATDGTVDCKHRKVGDMLSEAYDYLSERDGRIVRLAD